MAQNEINIKVKISDDGSLSLVSQKAEQAAKSTEKLTNSRNRYSKGEKGVAGATANGTKAFSKMRETLDGSGGLVAAYATIAARVFAVTAAFGVLQRAAAVQQLTQGITTLGQASGIAMKSLSEGLKQVTGDAITMEEAMRSTSMVIGAGFDSSTLEELGTVAKGAAIAMGRDTADAMARLTRGAVKLEPELLDELGIMVRLDEATAEFAKTLGKSANDLTSFERRQAFMNAVLEEGNEKFGELAAQDANPYDKLAAAFLDLTKSVVNFANESLGLKTIVLILADNVGILAGAFLRLGKGAIASSIAALFPKLVNLGALFVSSAEGAAKSAAANAQAAASNVEGTKAVNNYAAALANGERSDKGFAKAMRFGNQSLTSRIGHLKEHRKESGTFNRITFEKARGVMAARNAVNSLAMAEFKATVATKAHKEQLIFAALAEGNFGEALSRTNNQVLRFYGAATRASAGATMLGKASIYASATIKTVGLAVRFLGASLIALIPHIGIIILAFSALSAGLRFLYDTFYNTEALQAFTEQANKTINVNNELAESFKKLSQSKNAFDRVIGSGNAFTQLRDEASKLLATLQARDARSFSDGLSDLFSDIGMDTLSAMVGGEERKIAKSYHALARENEDIAKIFQHVGIEADQVFNNLFKDGRLNVGLLTYAINAMNGPVGNAVIAQAAMAKSIKGVNEQFRELMARKLPTTELDGFIAAADDLAKSVTAAKPKDFAPLLAGISDAEAGYLGIRHAMEQVGKFDKKTGKFTASLSLNAEATSKELKRILANRVAQMKLDKVTLQTAKARNAKAKAEVALVKAKFIFSGQAAELATAQNALLDEQVTTNNALLSQKKMELAALQNTVDTSGQRAVLTAEINELEAKNGKLAEDKVTVEEQAINVAQESINILKHQQEARKFLLDVANKELAVQKQLQNQQRTQTEMAMELAAAKQGRSATTAEQAAAAAQDPLLQSVDGELEVNKKLEADKIALAKERIALEFELLKLQFDLEKAKVARLEKQEVLTPKQAASLTGRLDEASGRVGAMQTAAEKAAVQAVEMEGKQALLNATVLQLNAEREQQQVRLDFLRKESEVLAANGQYADSIRAKATANALEMEQLLIDKKKETDPLALQNILIRENELRAEAVALERQRLQLTPAEQQALQLEQARIKLLRDRGTIQQAISAQQALNNEQIKTLQTELAAEVTTLERKLEIEREIAALKQSNIGLAQENIGIAGDTAIRMGAPEGMTNAITGIAQDQADPEGVMNQGTTSEKFAFLKEQTEGFMSDLAQLSPEGALMSAIAQGALQMGEAFSLAFEEMASGGLTVQTAMQAVGATISAIGAMQQAKANQAVSAIDKEIDAEKKKDGKSKESIAKIKALEAKKEKIKRKAFEKDKKMKMAQVISSTALAVMKEAEKGFPAAIPGIAMMVAMGAAQLAAISSTSYAGGGSSVDAGGSAPKEITVGGDRRTTTDLAKSRGAAGELAYFRGARGIGGPENFRPAASGMKYRANGGNTAFMVGEQGPEMFVPERPGTIVPSDETSQLGTPINANINITALDADGVEDILMNQRGNIIGMLRDAANANGETFLESISLQEY